MRAKGLDAGLAPGARVAAAPVERALWRAMADQAVAQLAVDRAEAVLRQEAVVVALERRLAECHAQETELKAMADRVAAGRAAAANMQAQRAAEAAEEQARTEQAFAEDAAFVAEALGYFLVVVAAALVRLNLTLTTDH